MFIFSVTGINYFLFFFLPFQVDRGPARKGALIPNIRSENLRGNSFSVCTLTRRNACNCLGCSTSPTDKWRFGSRTAAWRRRNWTEIDYNIIRPILCFRGQNSIDIHGALLWDWTAFTDRLTPAVTLPVYIVYHNGRSSNTAQWLISSSRTTVSCDVNYLKSEHELSQSVDFVVAIQTLFWGEM